MSVQVMCVMKLNHPLLNDESGVFLSFDHYRPDIEEVGLEDTEAVVLSFKPSAIEEALEENRRLEAYTRSD